MTFFRVTDGVHLMLLALILLFTTSGLTLSTKGKMEADKVRAKYLSKLDRHLTVRLGDSPALRRQKLGQAAAVAEVAKEARDIMVRVAGIKTER